MTWLKDSYSHTLMDLAASRNVFLTELDRVLSVRQKPLLSHLRRWKSSDY